MAARGGQHQQPPRSGRQTQDVDLPPPNPAGRGRPQQNGGEPMPPPQQLRGRPPPQNQLARTGNFAMDELLSNQGIAFLSICLVFPYDLCNNA